LAKVMAEVPGTTTPTKYDFRITALQVKGILSTQSRSSRAACLYLLRVFDARPEVKEACDDTVMVNRTYLRSTLAYYTRLQNIEARFALT